MKFEEFEKLPPFEQAVIKLLEQILRAVSIPD